MNEIHEYRKTSAEALGYTWCMKGFLSVVCDKDSGSKILWEPDEYADQMLMVWEWFREQKRNIDILEIIDKYIFFDETLFNATMEVFIKYQNTL